MTSTALGGHGVLVTRPRKQAGALIEAIENEGGRAISFPVMEIVPRQQNKVDAAVAALPRPDLVIFASPNAVEHGLQYGTDANTGAIGPATAAAIRAGGRIVDVCPASGFDSESLLDEPMMQDVSGQAILIIRGNDGRELLAKTLVARGANVDYLSVYDRKLARPSRAELDNVVSAWRNGEIDAVTVMSVESLCNLIAILPAECAARLADMPLVTPAARVIKEALDRYPASKPTLAAGPTADAMVQAIVQAIVQTSI